ncbi:hypothetical protein [Virgibacillus salexigens]|uniref:DUF1700 domain-containing protein n=1 Tax=Virgibacillus kapii TaxID=1638645 RepID=A0ABQ2E1D1_9BACI|nr:hypothetical protein [Virgibacillus kapii]GGJ77382.1 hypothetical protein GCM10007111_43730 [Virgibacillus kapii]
MKSLLKKFDFFTENIKRKVLNLIDQLAEKDIEKVNRQYELQYGKELNEKEIIEIKKNVIIRIWKYCSILLIVLLILLSSIF